MRNKFHVLLLGLVMAFISMGVYIYIHQPGAIHKLSYLALGDSYTVGTKIIYADNYPNQIADDLRKRNIDVADPCIIAYPGWTTIDLAKSIQERNIVDTFSFVTLLIGTNDIFEGYTSEAYSVNFESLLKRAIVFAGGDPDRVFVLAIPDISLTRYALSRNKELLSRSVAEYNAANREITGMYKCHYIDIAIALQAYVNNSNYFIADWAHPSAEGYRVWVQQVAPAIAQRLK